MAQNTLPVQYKMMYDNIEKKICDLAYVISFDEAQKTVYSPYIGDLELQIFTLMESILKTKAQDMENFKDMDKNRIHYEEVISAIIKDGIDVKITVIFEPYNFKKKTYNQIFKKTDSKITRIISGKPEYANNKNYKYNNAYQNLRHDFLNALPVVGTLEYLFEALAVVFFLLNVQNSTIFAPYTENDKDEKTAWVSNQGVAIRRTLNDWLLNILK